jgi:hypothetical protein
MPRATRRQASADSLVKPDSKAKYSLPPSLRQNSCARHGNHNGIKCGVAIEVDEKLRRTFSARDDGLPLEYVHFEPG